MASHLSNVTNQPSAAALNAPSFTPKYLAPLSPRTQNVHLYERLSGIRGTVEGLFGNLAFNQITEKDISDNAKTLLAQLRHIHELAATEGVVDVGFDPRMLVDKDVKTLNQLKDATDKLCKLYESLHTDASKLCKEPTNPQYDGKLKAIRHAFDKNKGRIEKQAKDILAFQPTAMKASLRLNTAAQAYAQTVKKVSQSVEVLTKTSEFPQHFLLHGQQKVQWKNTEVIKNNNTLSATWNKELSVSIKSAALYEAYTSYYLTYMEKVQKLYSTKATLVAEHTNLKALLTQASEGFLVDFKKLEETIASRTAELVTPEKALFDQERTKQQKLWEAIELSFGTCQNLMKELQVHSDGLKKDNAFHDFTKKLKSKSVCSKEAAYPEIQWLASPAVHKKEAEEALNSTETAIAQTKAHELLKDMASKWNEHLTEVDDIKKHLEWMKKTLPNKEKGSFYQMSTLLMDLIELQSAQRADRLRHKESAKPGSQNDNLLNRLKQYREKCQELETEKGFTRMVIKSADSLPLVLKQPDYSVWQSQDYLFISAEDRAFYSTDWELSKTDRTATKKNFATSVDNLYDKIKFYLTHARREIPLLETACETGFYPANETFNTAKKALYGAVSYIAGKVGTTKTESPEIEVIDMTDEKTPSVEA